MGAAVAAFFAFHACRGMFHGAGMQRGTWLVAALLGLAAGACQSVALWCTQCARGYGVSELLELLPFFLIHFGLGFRRLGRGAEHEHNGTSSRGSYAQSVCDYTRGMGPGRVATLHRC